MDQILDSAMEERTGNLVLVGMTKELGNRGETGEGWSFRPGHISGRKMGKTNAPKTRMQVGKQALLLILSVFPQA